MKKRFFFFGIAAFVAIIALTIPVLSCGGGDYTYEGFDPSVRPPSVPSIPSISAPKPSDIKTNISGAQTPDINDENAVEFLSGTLDYIMDSMEGMEGLSEILEEILEGIMSDINLPIGGGSDYGSEESENARKIYSESQRIKINFSDYAKDFEDFGLSLKGSIDGSYKYSYNDVTYDTSASGNINADCSAGFDINKIKNFRTDDVLTIDINFKAKGSMSMTMTEAKQNMSVAVGAAATFAMAYKIAETNEGAKIIITAGYNGFVNMNLGSEESSEPNLNNIKGSATLTIYDANNKKVYDVTMDMDDLMQLLGESGDSDYNDYGYPN